jgi:hypothetical protein
MKKPSTFSIRNIAFALAAVLSLAILPAAQATLLVQEQFSYSAADVVGDNGGLGWSGSWANPASGGTAPWGTGGVMGNRKADAPVVSPGLTYSGLSTSGNALSPLNQSAYRSWNASSLFTSAGSFWVSFLVTPGASAVNASMYVLPFAQNNATVAPDYQKGSGAKFSAGADGSTWTVTADIPVLQNGSGYTTPAARALTLNQANLIVMEFNYNGSGTDTIQLWVNPTLGGAAPLGTDVTTTTGNGWIDQLGEFMVKNGATTVATVDEINIGNTYGDVVSVPEPSTLALGLIGGIMGLVVVFRRRAIAFHPRQ